MRFLMLVLSIGLSAQVWGMGIGLNERQAKTESDIIAHVRIVTTTPAPNPLGTRNSDHKFDLFSQLATARVLTAVKGCKAGDVLTLAFDNGFACPNVFYTEKEECLVFLKKSADGPYNTMNLYCGRFLVKDGQVQYFYLINPASPAPECTPLATVMTWLKQPSPL